MNSAKIFTGAVLFLILSSLAIADGNPGLVVYEKKAEFFDVRQDLIDAIIDRGYVLDFNGRVGDMLRRTRLDLGGKLLYRDAEYMVFCTATLSQKMMETDTQNIAFCPFVLTVYEKESNLGTIYVSYRKLSSAKNIDASLAAVDKMLDEISRDAVQ